MRKIALALTMAIALPVAAHAQKKVLTQADWDKWKSINALALSPDGKWAVYTLIPQVGDGELVIRSTASGTEYHVPRGFIGRPNNIPGGLRGPAGGTGEVIFSKVGARRSEAARGFGGAAIPRGQEVVITAYADGFATVQPWGEFLAARDSALKSAGAENRKA